MRQLKDISAFLNDYALMRCAESYGSADQCCALNATSRTKSNSHNMLTFALCKPALISSSR